MKLAIVVPDGMADRPHDFENGRTPLEVARTPVMDALAREGEVGTVVTVPEDVTPGSDAAIMAVLGVNPGKHRVGRAAIEAAGRGIELADSDVVFRENLVAIRDGLMADYSGGVSDTEQARPLIEGIDRATSATLASKTHCGVAYRHLVVFHDADGLEEVESTPPHDIQGKMVSGYRPKGDGAERVLEYMRLADETLPGGAGGPTNVWLWGQGRRAELPGLAARFEVTGAVISAVDLVRGLGRALGMDVIEVDGATGDVDTNFAGKGEAAALALEAHDVVLVHIEAPDEASHRGDAEAKGSAIEAVDREVLARVRERAEERGDTRVLVLPDHLTPCSIRTHAHGGMPFVLWGPGVEAKPAPAFTEREAAKTGLHVERGWELLAHALGEN